MSTLREELVAFGLLAVGFIVFSFFVALGGMFIADHELQRTLLTAWRPDLQLPLQAIALLAGPEATAALWLGLGAYLWRRGYRRDLWGLLAFPAGVVLELVYKHILAQPAPAPASTHADAPSLVSLFASGHGGNSYPSGHIVRAVIVYGLLAFVIWRLGRRGWLRRGAVVVVVAFLALEGFDRLYLGVHWESDVIGGFLLGGACLVAAMLWLDRPRRVAAGE